MHVCDAAYYLYQKVYVRVGPQRGSVAGLLGSEENESLGLWRLRAHLLFLWREDDEGGGVGVRSRSFARAVVLPRCSRPLGGTLRN
eukprot:scaffold2296_cov853-Pavlova_lutheri.AAC.1